MGYWLFKSEPDEFSIDDLKRKGPQGECWEGVRNYQARNFLRDQVKQGDLVLFYHSSCKEVGVAGIAEVIKPAFADPFQFDPNSRYFDGKAMLRIEREKDLRTGRDVPVVVVGEWITGEEAGVT